MQMGLDPIVPGTPKNTLVWAKAWDIKNGYKHISVGESE
jgi:hypothetical protein